MILKKPYAFLIKHFRLIHFILAIMTIYLAYSINKIVLFFNSYISAGYRLTESNIAGNYITVWMYIAVILALLIAIIIYLLFKAKDKPSKYYVYFIVYYIFIFSLLTLAYNLLQGIEITVIDAKTIRVYRDLSLILSAPQYFFVVFAAFRGIGFDIKKFNFSKDLNDLQIEAKDNEEFEFVLDVPTYKIKRTLRRTLRELKYFLLENVFGVIAILVLISGIIGTSIYMNRNVYSVTYKENQTFTFNNYKMRVLSSVITPYAYNGDKLVDNKTYLVVLISIQNNTILEKSLNKDNFRLLVDKKVIYPTLNKNEYFIDLGTPYSNQKIASKSNSTYTFVYELNENEIKENYILRIQEFLNYRQGEIIANYKEVKLKPSIVNTISKVKTVNINENLDLKASSLSNSSLLISNYEVTKSYKYNYNFCIESDCYVSTDTVDATYQTEKEKTLLVLTYTLELDENTPYKNNIKSDVTFFNHFLKVKYTYNDKEYISNVTNKTPNTMTDKVILETDGELKSATKIMLIITIRNKEYNIILK